MCFIYWAYHLFLQILFPRTFCFLTLCVNINFNEIKYNSPFFPDFFPVRKYFHIWLKSHLGFILVLTWSYFQIIIYNEYTWDLLISHQKSNIKYWDAVKLAVVDFKFFKILIFPWKAWSYYRQQMVSGIFLEVTSLFIW